MAASPSNRSIEGVFGARRLAAVAIENAQKGRIVGSLAALRKEVLGLHGGDLLGGGDDQKLVHAGPVALADPLHRSLQRDGQPQGKSSNSRSHGFSLLSTSPGRRTSIPKRLRAWRRSFSLKVTIAP